jgi:AhpD family alkylhydroperoxidase
MAQEDDMKARLDPYKAAPATMKAVIALEGHVQKSGLDPKLVELVKLRASQINGCAYCVDMHGRAARAKGESEERLLQLTVWRESPLYTDAERAALAWTEALTRLHETGAPDATFEELRRHFSEGDVVELTILIGMINLWNRVGVGFRLVPSAGSVKASAAE